MSDMLTTTAVTWEAVLEELEDRRDEFHAQRYVPRDFVDKLISLGVYRAAAPQRFGGETIAPADFIRIIERVSSVDASTGWVVAFASALTYLGALPIETQKSIYQNGPDVVYAGGLFPMQPATRTANGYRVSGRWRFASGVMAAEWIGVGILDESAGGRPRAGLVRPEQVEIVDNWNVTGMVASGSFDVIAHDVEIPEELTFIRGGASNIDEPLFRYPLVAYQAQVHAAVSLGAAQAALAYAVEHGSRAGITGAPPLAARSYFRADFAKARTKFTAARAIYLETAEEVWQTVLAGDPASEDQIACMRLTSAYVAEVSAQTVHDLVTILGTDTLSVDSPMRIVRQDAQVPQMHATLGQAVYESGGAVLLGQQPPLPGFL